MKSCCDLNELGGVRDRFGPEPYVQKKEELAWGMYQAGELSLARLRQLMSDPLRRAAVTQAKRAS